MNLQVIASPGGAIVWVSGPLPGAVHDLTAARIWGIVRELAASGLVMLGDKGYLGEDCIRTPYRGRNKPAAQKDANRAHARLRTPGERANARLKTLAHPAQAPLLPLARRSTGQGHPCPSDPRNRWMKRLSVPTEFSHILHSVCRYYYALIACWLGRGFGGGYGEPCAIPLRSGVTLRFWAVAPRLLKAAPGMVSLNRPER